MAHTKSGGSTALGRDSQSKRLGLKLHDGELAAAGAIIVRQRGTKYLAGRHVRVGGDDTLYAGLTGTVHFKREKRNTVTGQRRVRLVVHLTPRV